MKHYFSQSLCINRVWVLIALTGLSACNSIDQTTQHGQYGQPANEAMSAQNNAFNPAQLDAIGYYSWVITAAAEQLQSEQQRLEAEITGHTGEHSLVQLAVLISAPSSDNGQQQRALTLLEQYEQRSTGHVPDDYRALAHLWRQVLEPRLQSHELQQKIDALTIIEQQLGNREQQGD